MPQANYCGHGRTAFGNERISRTASFPLWTRYDYADGLPTGGRYVSPGDRVYEHDAIGNRRKSADGLILPGTDNYVSNTLNQYTAVPSAPTPPVPGYDADGNATAFPVPAAPTQNATLAWDGENRLITTTVAGTETTAQYDALSRRIAQTTGATREVTLYDGWNCIAEYEGAANTLHATNLWGTDLSGSPQGAGGVGGLLAVQKHTGPATGINYPLYDGNGNITEYLNAAGAVVAHYKYDPFGRIYASSGTLKDAFPYRFSTKRLDAATGLYYYGYRYYDPVTGRWLSGDPIEEGGGVNLYAFVNNDPNNRIDYLGLEWKVDRENTKRLASVCATSESDTWDALGKKVFLDGNEANKWVANYDAAVKPGKSYQIPNTMVTIRLFNREKLLIHLTANASQSSFTKRMQDQGYFVESLTLAKTVSSVVSAVTKHDVAGFHLVGHGAVGVVTIGRPPNYISRFWRDDNEMLSSLDVSAQQKFKYSVIMLNVCEAGQGCGSPLRDGRRMNNLGLSGYWNGLVSQYGTFYGRTGTVFGNDTHDGGLPISSNPNDLDAADNYLPFLPAP